MDTLKEPLEYKPLIDVADLVKAVGFKGNYMIFLMKDHNALTDHMGPTLC